MEVRSLEETFKLERQMVSILKHFSDEDCKVCGSCCRTENVELLPNEHPKLNIDINMIQEREYGFIKLKTPCPFYDGICKIQNNKPFICKRYPFGYKTTKTEKMTKKGVNILIIKTTLNNCKLGRRIISELFKVDVSNIQLDRNTEFIFDTDIIPIFLKQIRYNKEKL